MAEKNRRYNYYPEPNPEALARFVDVVLRNKIESVLTESGAWTYSQTILKFKEQIHDLDECALCFMLIGDGTIAGVHKKIRFISNEETGAPFVFLDGDEYVIRGDDTEKIRAELDDPRTKVVPLSWKREIDWTVVELGEGQSYN